MNDRTEVRVNLELTISDEQFSLAKNMVNIYLEQNRDVRPCIHMVVPQEGKEYYRITT